MNKAGYVFKDENIQNRLFLHSKCNCGQKDCATVYLKSKKPFKEESTGINIFNTNKGFIVFNNIIKHIRSQIISYRKRDYYC